MCTNLSTLISSSEVDKHDIADDCANWQKGIKSFKDHAHKHDLESLYYIPSSFAANGRPVGPYTNLLEHFRSISDTQVFTWQKYLNENASSVDIESGEWAEGILIKTIDDQLKTAVEDALGHVQRSEQGAITTFKIMSNKMVLMNQESIDALQSISELLT